MDTREDIGNLTIEELTERFADMGEPEFRARQVFDWLYVKLAPDFNRMTNLPMPLREKLSEIFRISSLEPDVSQTSIDGSVKNSYILRDGAAIESVMMPSPGPNRGTRMTLCVSSQAGCSMACKFCMTGRNGFMRDLETAEIIGQFISAIRMLKSDAKISNIVFMGMGEPFRNFDNVVRALRILTSESGFGFSPSRITVSTSGIVDRIEEFGKLELADLAVSLNAADDNTRSAIMPVNKKYPLADLIAECRKYPAGPQKRITFEYVLLRGVNSAPRHADNLVRLLAGIDCKVNLIPFNECRGMKFKSPSMGAVNDFRDTLKKAGIPVFVRASMGRDISAACGQLAGWSLDKNR